MGKIIPVLLGSTNHVSLAKETTPWLYFLLPNKALIFHFNSHFTEKNSVGIILICVFQHKQALTAAINSFLLSVSF